jgi:hypothetical protein
MTRWSFCCYREKTGITALLRTCREVYIEAITPFYNRFDFCIIPGLPEPNNKFELEAKVILPKMQHITIDLRRRLHADDEGTDHEDVERLCNLFQEYGRRPRLMHADIWTLDWRGKAKRSTITSEMVEDAQKIAADPAV